MPVFHTEAVSEPENHHSPEISEVGKFKTLPGNFVGDLEKYYSDLR